MEKKPEVDGKWIDIEADDIMSRMADIEKCELLAIRSLRIDLGADDRDAFVEKFNRVAEESAEEIAEMDGKQKSFYILRKMVVR